MKKSVFVIAMFLLAISAKAEKPQMTLDQEFVRTYQQVLAINQTRFSDLKKIPVGEVIFVPSRWDERDIEMIELRPPVNGQHDCLWLLVHRYVYGEPTVLTKPVAVPSGNVTAPSSANASALPATETPKKANRLWWLAILPIIPLTIGGRKWWKKKNNPDNYPPVGQNLDSLEPAAVIAEIQRVYEKNGDKVLEIKRGALCRLSGPNKIKVLMKFGDDKDRNVWIFPNESVCKIKIRNIFGNESYQYCRSACTNGMILYRFELPKGWEFVINQETLRPAALTTVEEEKPKATILIVSAVPETELNFTEAKLLPKSNKKLPRCRRCKKTRRHKNCKRFNKKFGLARKKIC